MPDASPSPAGEHNTCGVLVQTLPGRVHGVGEALARLPGVEVHQVCADGRLVVTVEDTAGRKAAETLSAINVMQGVLCAALVFHHCDRGDAATVAAQEV